ncbi:hypothetical protein F1544_02515 [Kineosporiaceae bacterium B12]|nr:hypothetical protein [Kineococcus rubinsiae]
MFYPLPDAEPVTLAVEPRLASWMERSHPDQVELERFLDHAQALLVPRRPPSSEPVGLRLDVGLKEDVDLLDQRDLDNYAFPLSSRLSRAWAEPPDSVWVGKKHSRVSTAAVASVVATDRPSVSDDWVEVRTTASTETSAYKQQIRDQLSGVEQLPDGPVAVEISFLVGPRRNWLNLWKPSIDALEALLGRTTPTSQWHPRDGRIVALGLHRRVDETLGNDVRLAIASAPRPDAPLSSR